METLHSAHLAPGAPCTQTWMALLTCALCPRPVPSMCCAHCFRLLMLTVLGAALLHPPLSPVLCVLCLRPGALNHGCPTLGSLGPVCGGGGAQTQNTCEGGAGLEVGDETRSWIQEQRSDLHCPAGVPSRLGTGCTTLRVFSSFGSCIHSFHLFFKHRGPLPAFSVAGC